MTYPGREGTRRRYRAFVSYARTDKRLALRLHRALESYRIPVGLGVAVSPDRRLGRIFLDRHELGASDRLGAAIKGALDDSDTFILVASPNAAHSFWVAQEIQHFCTGPPRPILALVASGWPNAGTSEDECFPEHLRARGPMQQPLAANLPEEGFDRAFLRLVGGLIDVPFDRLWQRERRSRRRRRLAAGIAFIVAVAIIASALVLGQMRLDRQALVAASAERARDGWQNAWRPEYFGAALRDAISAARLSPGGAGLSTCDLSQPIESPVCALALSGRALPSTLLFGTPPEGQQVNIRRDIDGASNHERRMILRQPHPRAIALSEQPFRIAIVTSAPRLFVIDPDNPVTLERMLEHSTQALAISSDASRVLLGASPGQVQTVGADERLEQIAGLTGRIDHAEALDDGWLLLTDDRTLVRLDRALATVWRTETVETGVYNMEPLARGAQQVAVLQSYGGRGLVAVHDSTTGDRRDVSDTHIGEGVGQVKSLAIDPGGARLVLGGNGSGGGNDAGGQIIDLTTGRETARLTGVGAEIYAAAFLPETGLVATGGSDFAIRIWDAATGAERLRLIGHVAPIQDLAVSVDRRHLVSASWDGTVRAWQLPADWDGDAGALLGALCESDSGDQAPRHEIPTRDGAVAARPADPCDWRGPDGFAGWAQALLNLALR